MTNDTDHEFGRETRGPVVALPAAAPAQEPAKAKETHEARSKRRAGELAALLADHKDKVAAAHKDLPTPNKKFADMSREERRRWNGKRKRVSESNRAYYLAVRAACSRHREEDVVLQRAAAEDETKAKSTKSVKLPDEAAKEATR